MNQAHALHFLQQSPDSFAITNRADGGKPRHLYAPMWRSRQRLQDNLVIWRQHRRAIVCNIQRAAAGRRLCVGFPLSVCNEVTPAPQALKRLFTFSIAHRKRHVKPLPQCGHFSSRPSQRV
jgi:hypothetical protein